MDFILINENRKTHPYRVGASLPDAWRWAQATGDIIAREIKGEDLSPEYQAVLTSLVQTFNHASGLAYISQSTEHYDIYQQFGVLNGVKGWLIDRLNEAERKSRPNQNAYSPARVVHAPHVPLHMQICAPLYEATTDQDVTMPVANDYRARFLNQIAFVIPQNKIAHELIHYAYGLIPEDDQHRLYKTTVFSMMRQVDALLGFGPALFFDNHQKDAHYADSPLQDEEMLAWNTGYLLGGGSPIEAPVISGLITAFLPLELNAIRSGNTAYRKRLHDSLTNKAFEHPPLYEATKALKAFMKVLFDPTASMTQAMYTAEKDKLQRMFALGFADLAQTLVQPQAAPHVKLTL